MPTYEYECGGCGYRFEAVQSIHADALKDCPECRQAQLRRVIFAPMLAKVGEPRTLGVLAERNARELERRGELPKQVRRRKDYVVPWWRKGKHKIDRRILDNPQQYIETGRV